MTELEQISADLKRVTKHDGGADGLMHALMTGKVVAGSVDMGALTCTVQLTGDDTTAPTEGVQLNVVTPGSGTGMILFPADNSNVIVGSVDGGGSYQLIWCDQLMGFKVIVGSSSLQVVDGTIKGAVGSSSVQVQDGVITLNGGGLDGLVKLAAAVSRYNKIEADVNMLKQIFSTGWVVVPNDGGAALKAAAAVWAGNTLTETVNSDIENNAIKQG